MATTSAPRHDHLADDSTTSSSVFETGDLSVQTINLESSSSPSSPPKPLLIFSPSTKGTYPVLLHCHGFFLKNSGYSQLLTHVASHGFIVVAPQLYTWNILTPVATEIEAAAKVTDWLSTGLEPVLPDNVYPNVDKLALSGHSRGGKTAFALALGHASTNLKFSALIGVEPVAGCSPSNRSDPKILTYVPRSLDLSIPVAVIGASLSDQPKGLIRPFAPDGVNHAEFFNESKPPCCYFLARDYGHCDMLNEKIANLASLVCQSGKGSKDPMRRAVGGVMVAFLKASLVHEMEQLEAIADGSLVAPITLDPIINLMEECHPIPSVFVLKR